MSDYSTVKNAMKAGTPHELICQTCPWDRLCITPPQMSGADVDRQLQEAQQPPEPGESRDGAVAVALMKVMLFAGKDTQANLCPVFAARLSTEDGRLIADSIRNSMRGEG